MGFDQCFSSLAGSLTRLLWSSQLMSAALPHRRQCTNLWMSLYLSAYLAHSLYHAGCPGQRHQEYNIQHRDNMNLDRHIQPANWWLRIIELRDCDDWAPVTFLAEHVSPLELAIGVGRVEVHQFPFASSLSTDSMQCHVGKVGIQLCGFETA